MTPLPKPESRHPSSAERPVEPIWATMRNSSAVEETVLAAEAALKPRWTTERTSQHHCRRGSDVEPPTAARTITIQPLQITKLDEIEDVAVARAINGRLTLDSAGGDLWRSVDARRSGASLWSQRSAPHPRVHPGAGAATTDDVIAQDVLGGRPGTPDFEQLRFAVNFGLSRNTATSISSAPLISDSGVSAVLRPWARVGRNQTKSALTTGTLLMIRLRRPRTDLGRLWTGS